jgi:hypothetical protein
MRKSFGLVWLLLAVLVPAGCKKEEAKSKAPEQAEETPSEGSGAGGERGETPAPEQPGSGTGTGGGVGSGAGRMGAGGEASRDEAMAVMAALDRSGGDILGAAMQGAGKAAMLGGTGTAADDGAVRENDEPSPFDRMQALIDLGRVRGTPIGQVLQLVLNAAKAENEDVACLFDLVDRLETVFFDLSIGASGDPESVLVSARLAVAQPEMLACMRSTLDPGESVAEVQIAGRTAWTKEPPEDNQPFLAEAEPGRWLLGTRAALEAALAGGTDPAADAGFAGYAQALGEGAVTLALAANDRLRAGAAGLGAEMPAQGQCMVDAIRRIQGIGIGVNLAAGVKASLVVRNGSASEAGETHRCLGSLWQMFRPFLAEALRQEAGEMLQEMQLSAEQILDLPQMDSTGEFARVQLQLPDSVLGFLMQQAMGGGF